MKNILVAGLLTAILSSAILAVPAQARCEGDGSCGGSLHRVSKPKPISLHAGRQPRRTHVARSHHRQGAAKVARRDNGRVAAMITAMAPSYGVPTWFALRIAKVESNYNPGARGSAGELGVYQLKCPTARGIGYRGACSGLLDARTNIQYGLKHLAMAMKASGGNLRLTASKHNGGLGRKTVVRGYVAMVF